MMDYDDMIRVLPPADPVVGGNVRIDTKEKKEEEEMKKLTASLLSAALVASLAVSASAFASGTENPTDGTWDYPYYKTTATAPSQYAGTGNEGPASYVVDGKPATYWHSNWDTNHPENGSTDLTNDPDHRYIQLELDKVVELNALRYLPRPASGDGGNNGRVKQYRVEVSTTGADEERAWTEVASGTWESNGEWKIAAFDAPAQAKYVRLYGVTTEGAGSQGNMYMSCGELRVQTTQVENTNIFLNKTASASSQLTDQEANKANDGDTNTQWCANWRPDASPAADKTLRGNWWQVDLGEVYEVDELNLVFEQSATWQYHVAVSDDPAFTDYTFDDAAITTVTAAKTTVDVNHAGQYVRVYVMSSTQGRWPCLKEVSGTGTVVTTPEVTKEEVQALVNEANGKLGEWYKSGWSDYSEAIANAKTVLGQTDPTAKALAAAKQAIEIAKGNLVERDQYTAKDPFVFPSQPDVTATLEAEFGELHDVKLDTDGKWYLQVAASSWASHGEFLNCFNQQDTVTYHYNAPVAGTYSVTATYRSGSTTNQLAWSGDKIQSGNVAAGAKVDNEQNQTRTVTFDLVVTQAGAGTLVFTGPDTKSPQLDKLDISLKQATYTVTVNTATGGTASANFTNAAPGTEVTLTAQADQGYHFKEWQVQGDTVTITENKFTMPQGNVTITPVFEAHSYGQPTFAWAEDGKSASATFTCGTCQDEQTVKATITSEVKTEATCTEKGTTTYTATVNFGGKDYTATKDVQKGHHHLYRHRELRWKGLHRHQGCPGHSCLGSHHRAAKWQEAYLHPGRLHRRPGVYGMPGCGGEGPDHPRHRTPLRERRVYRV